MARLEIFTAQEGAHAIVTLSRRNLLTLLHKLDMPGSMRMLANRDSYIDGNAVTSLLLLLRAEDDPEHYATRVSPPGPVHPVTEAFIGNHDGWTTPPQG